MANSGNVSLVSPEEEEEDSDQLIERSDKRKRNKETKDKKKKKKKKKEKKKKQKKKKEEVRKRKRSVSSSSSSDNEQDDDAAKRTKISVDSSEPTSDPSCSSKDNNNNINNGYYDDDKIVQSSGALEDPPPEGHTVALLLFYQYVEPPWDPDTYQMALSAMRQVGKRLGLGGRMRVAREGLNCTLTSTEEGSIREYCRYLRTFHCGEFQTTEFKLTTNLPRGQHFGSLKVMPVTELVNYGLEGSKAPPLQYTGTHLDPKDYHKKLGQDNTVVIDVRNHYEAAIGRFLPPSAAQWVDPKMRKSTEFPVWLDKPSTRDQLRGKQVLMYCTGGVRCERASALLQYKMEKDQDYKDLNIKGVYQLQGGIDKYFKEFPEGGYWKGKNYTFDKRFAHVPSSATTTVSASAAATTTTTDTALGNCEACGKAWDRYRGKRRCPTCGVPSLICRDCYQADQSGERKLDRNVRCDLCVAQNVRSKREIREREAKEMQEYQAKLVQKGLLQGNNDDVDDDDDEEALRQKNPKGVTRLLLKNMCRNKMDEATLMQSLPGITHIVWKTDRKTGQFYGSGWVEMATPLDAARAMAKNGQRVLGRPLYIEYQPPDGKDSWPPPHSSVL